MDQKETATVGRADRWRVLYAVNALGSGQLLRAMRDSGLFHPERLHFIGHSPPHLQLRDIADDVLAADAVDEFVTLCETIYNGSSEVPR